MRGVGDGGAGGTVEVNGQKPEVGGAKGEWQKFGYYTLIRRAKAAEGLCHCDDQGEA